MKSEKENSRIAFLLVIIIILGGILLFKIMSDKKVIENVKASSISTNIINNDNSTSNNSNNTVGLGKEFKQAMDSYETIMDAYIEFMVKFKDNRTNVQIIKEYTEWLKKYADAVDAFNKWDDKNLNKEEAKYYVDVQTRVTQKLLNASIDISYQ